MLSLHANYGRADCVWPRNLTGTPQKMTVHDNKYKQCWKGGVRDFHTTNWPERLISLTVGMGNALHNFDQMRCPRQLIEHSMKQDFFLHGYHLLGKNCTMHFCLVLKMDTDGYEPVYFILDSKL